MFASSNDPYCSLERARQMADAWGSQLHNTGEFGHLNSESGLGDWPQAFAKLQQLMACSPAA